MTVDRGLPPGWTLGSLAAPAAGGDEVTADLSTWRRLAPGDRPAPSRSSAWSGNGAERLNVSPREATGFEHRWLGMDGIFGDFVLGRVVDAADALDGFSPQAVTTHFVGAIRPGEVELVTETVHRGRDDREPTRRA